MTTQPPDPFAGGDSVPSLSFANAPIGTAYSGTVTVAPAIVPSRNFKTKEPDYWPDGNPKMAVVTRLALPTGEERSLWASMPSAMFAAVKEAQSVAGKQIAVGGHLAITFTGQIPAKDATLSPQKLYTATYTPPDPFAVPVSAAVNPWTGQPATPPPAFAPPAAPPVTAAPAAPAGPTPEQIAAYLASQQPIAPPAPAAPIGYTPEQRAAAAAAGIPLPGV